jgi:hypothetical protein
MPAATIRVPSLKLTVPLAADALPRDIVPMDAPAGEPTLELVLEGTPLTARAKLNGKNYRQLLKQIGGWRGQCFDRPAGALHPPAAPGGPFVLDSAGFQVNVKTPRRGPVGPSVVEPREEPV